MMGVESPRNRYRPSTPGRTFPVAKITGTPRSERETEVALEPTVPAEEVASRVAPLGIKVEHTGFAIHLFQPTAGKLAAARIALEGLGLSLEDCLFAGDGDNDVELLRAVGVGVSFPDASPRARAAADYVTRARRGAGFLEALKRFGLMPGPREGVH